MLRPVPDSPEYPDVSGILHAKGYVSAGFAASVVVFFCLVFATLVTRRHIPELAPAIPTRAPGEHCPRSAVLWRIDPSWQ
ncbi:MAG: hypothetical protein CBC10_009395 [Gammaproteobacteria bacterium TMED50]|nr:MAG: hypothetical protein CBC10_009395 [Gammaproteobacteria bacterium TMED50]